MADEKQYVLWLPSWYPCNLTPYDGDFIRRQAVAVSRKMPVHVIHLVKDEYRVATKDVLIETSEEGDLRETIIYYTSPSIFFKPLEKFIALARFGHIYRKFIRNYFKLNDLPLIVHAHVAMKAGLIAKWIRRTFGIPYLLTEHWTIYLEEARPQLKDLSFARQYLISQVVSEASRTVTVSHHLGKAMQKKWPFLEYEVIPNVVDHSIFYPNGNKATRVIRLLHVSAMNYQKDPESLFAAASILKQHHVPFTLDVCGLNNLEIKNMVINAGVINETTIHGEIPQTELAKLMRQSDALILYSRFETFGCVIIEANACGIPVLVPDTSLMHELILDGVNGLFVEPGNPAALAEKIVELHSGKHKFNPIEISKTTEQYSYENVAQRHVKLYDTLLNPVIEEE